MSAVEQKADVLLLFSMLEGDVKIPKEKKNWIIKIFNVSEISLFCSPRLHLFIKKKSESCDIISI